MKIVLQADVSGTRNGQSWPPRGTTVDLPDDEAAQMIRASLALPLADSEQVASEATRRAAAGFEEIIPGPAPVVPPSGDPVHTPTAEPYEGGPLTTDTGPARKPRTSRASV